MQTIDELATAGVRTVSVRPVDAVETTVVVDAAGEPWQVVAGGTAYPAVVLAAETRIVDVAAGRELVRTVTRAVPGVVVVDDGRVAGFVPRARLVDALLLGSGVRDSDPLLHGEARAVSGAVRVRCRTCHTINTYDFYLPDEEKPCVQGHPLDPDL